MPLGETISPAASSDRFPLCGGCSEWISEVVKLARQNQDDLSKNLVTRPVKLAVRDDDDRCFFCRAMLRSRSAVMGLNRMSPDNGSPLVTNGLCPSCEQWLVNLAIDGMSARRVSRRQSEGEYGATLHPKLAHIRVDFAMEDEHLAASLRDDCERIGASIASTSAETTTSVVFAEAAGHGQLPTEFIASRVVLDAPAGTNCEAHCPRGPPTG